MQRFIQELPYKDGLPFRNALFNGILRRKNRNLPLDFFRTKNCKFPNVLSEENKPRQSAAVSPSIGSSLGPKSLSSISSQFTPRKPTLSASPSREMIEGWCVDRPPAPPVQ
jgi:hypothetical protein